MFVNFCWVQISGGFVILEKLLTFVYMVFKQLDYTTKIKPTKSSKLP